LLVEQAEVLVVEAVVARAVIALLSLGNLLVVAVALKVFCQLRQE
jgi:hypothetical protein